MLSIDLATAGALSSLPTYSTTTQQKSTRRPLSYSVASCPPHRRSFPCVESVVPRILSPFFEEGDFESLMSHFWWCHVPIPCHFEQWWRIPSSQISSIFKSWARVLYQVWSEVHETLTSRNGKTVADRLHSQNNLEQKLHSERFYNKYVMFMKVLLDRVLVKATWSNFMIRLIVLLSHALSVTLLSFHQPTTYVQNVLRSTPAFNYSTVPVNTARTEYSKPQAHNSVWNFMIPRCSLPIHFSCCHHK